MFSDDVAQALVNRLRRDSYRIVFAESCTAGLIAATLGRIAGVSQILAGSAVTYQEATKEGWLDVDSESMLRSGVVSEIVSRQMALGVLRTTPHADLSASVTGHLGPGAPPNLDGVVWSCVAIRTGQTIRISSQKFELSSTLNIDVESDGTELRRERQFDAVRRVMLFCIDCLESPESMIEQ